MRNATSWFFSQSTVHNMKKKRRKKIRLHKSIFIYFFILLFSSFARFLSLLGVKVCVVLFTEWKIVITSSTFQHFSEKCFALHDWIVRASGFRELFLSFAGNSFERFCQSTLHRVKLILHGILRILSGNARTLFEWIQKLCNFLVLNQKSSFDKQILFLATSKAFSAESVVTVQQNIFV